MVNYFEDTMKLFNKYNEIVNGIHTSLEETTDEEDEFFINFPLYFAHALLKDFGTGGTARDELLRTAKVLQAVIED